jgi:hypothetical protein
MGRHGARKCVCAWEQGEDGRGRGGETDVLVTYGMRGNVAEIGFFNTMMIAASFVSHPKQT